MQLPSIARRRLKSKQRAAVSAAAVLNVAIVLALMLSSDMPASPLWGAIGFWCVVLVRPDIVDAGYLFQPRNYMFLLFFVTIVLSPPLLYVTDSWLTRWILDYNPLFWNYVGTTLALWLLAFVSYAAGLLFRLRSESKPAEADAPTSLLVMGHSDFWVGLVLLVLGVGGLVMAAGGSLDAVLAIRGQRAAAVEIINRQGTGRYLIWFAASGFGLCLLWLGLFRAMRLRPATALVLLFALYLPMSVFFSYTSGRAATVIPLLTLLNFYYLHCRKFSAWWAVGAFLVCLPLFGVWSLIRQDGWDFTTDASVFRLALEVLLGAFSRLDVSIAAIAGSSTYNLPWYYGETILAALVHPIPEWIFGRPFTGGTMAMASAIFGDARWDEASGMATPLLVEGYVNFGVAGIVLVHALLGRLVLWNESLHRSRDPLTVVFGISLMFALPFGASLEVIMAGFVWNVVFPYVVALSLRRLLMFRLRPIAKRAQQRP